MKVCVWGAALAALATTSAPAGAANPLVSSFTPSQWAACDGYGRPTQNGDGMTKEALGFLGVFTGGPSAGNTFRSTPPTFGDAGVQACTAVLTDGGLRPQFWARKVSLLRARAIHQLAGGHSDAAMADLQAAEAAAQAPGDPYYQRSLGLGIKLVRALALERQDRHAEAQAIASEVMAARPWNRSTVIALFATIADERAIINGEPLLVAIARLQPKQIDSIFSDAMRTRDFRRAVQIYPNLVPPTKVLDRGIYGIEQEIQVARNEAVESLFKALRRASLAYAQAASGDAPSARSSLTAAEQELKELAEPLPKLVPGTKEGRKARIRRAINGAIVAAGKDAADQLARWRFMTELRLQLSAGQAPSSAPDLLRILPNGPGLDLLITLEEHGNKEAAPFIEALQKRLEPARMPSKDQIELLFEALPHAEIAERIATYRKAQSPLAVALWGGASGFRTKANPDGSTTISFTGEKSSGSVVEEMALLRAADFTRAMGKSAFVIISRADFQRSLTTSIYGVAGRAMPTGYTTELTIQPVDSINPPEPYRSAPWRMIDAAKVVDSLGPTYFVATATPPRS